MHNNSLARTLARGLRSRSYFYRPVSSDRQADAVLTYRSISSATRKASEPSVTSNNEEQPPLIESHQPLRLKAYKPLDESKAPVTKPQIFATTSAKASASATSDAEAPPDAPSDAPPDEPDSVPSGPRYWQHIKRWQDVTPEGFTSWKFQVSVCSFHLDDASPPSLTVN